MDKNQTEQTEVIHKRSKGFNKLRRQALENFKGLNLPVKSFGEIVSVKKKHKKKRKK